MNGNFSWTYDKSDHKKHILKVMCREPIGIPELDIAERLNLNRRTVNNYLRELKLEDKVYREHACWFSKINSC